jgi:NAD(P)-dependent dehydrogenase (short-subunit alcohol dehydrogenase family)
VTDTVHGPSRDLLDIRSRVIVITGSGGVLGRCYSQAFAARGASLVLADLRDSDPAVQAETLASEFDTPAIGMACDVRSEDDVRQLFDAAVKRFGRVDVVLNNAAATGEHLMRSGNVFARFEDYPVAMWEDVLRTNLTGVFLVAREGGKRMLAAGAGSLINVASIYGVVAPDHRIYEGMPFSSFAAYSASKAGVHGLTLWLATYWARSGIRVNTVCPGGVYNGHDPEFVRRYADRTPMGRMANPEDLVGTMVYLASDASRYCTGQRFLVDGGLSAW